VTGLMRHWTALRNVSLTATRVPFWIGAARVGWVRVSVADWLRAQGCTRTPAGVRLGSEAGLSTLAQRVADRGELGLRGEAFDVRATFDGPVLSTLDRGAVPWFGVLGQGVHVNGLVRRADGPHLWVARRAADRLIDPGKLDHLFAGGVAAGSSVLETLAKEGLEEAGLGPEITGQAVPAGTLDYVTERPEGLRRDRLHCFDLWLTEDVRPAPADGEVADYELWPLERVMEALWETDDFKFNVALVLIDLLLRLGLVPEDERAALAAGDVPSAIGGRDGLA